MIKDFKKKGVRPQCHLDCFKLSKCGILIVADFIDKSMIIVSVSVYKSSS